VFHLLHDDKTIGVLFMSSRVVLTSFLLCFCILAAIGTSTAAEQSQGLPRVGVTLKTSDAFLQHLYDEAERRARDNIVEFGPQRKVIVEGGGYTNVWLETQPMAGAMYAARNLQIGTKTHRLDVAPNAVWAINQGGEPTLAEKSPFDYPYQREKAK